MRYTLCCKMAALKVFLVFNIFAVCLAQNNDMRDWNSNNLNNYNWNNNWNNNYNQFNQTNQNTTVYGEGRNIERPCEIFDVNCIRHYLAKHSKCKEVHGTVKEPLYRAQAKAFLTNLNTTLTLDDVEYRSLNGRIQEFFVNRETDKLILAAEFRNLYTASERTYFKVYRRAREPVTTVDFLKVQFSSITITIIIPNLKDLKLSRGETFSYVADAYPRISIGPHAFASSDPTVRRVAADFFTNLPISVREAFLVEGVFIITTFIQKTLCDFGLDVL